MCAGQCKADRVRERGRGALELELEPGGEVADEQ